MIDDNQGGCTPSRRTASHHHCTDPHHYQEVFCSISVSYESCLISCYFLGILFIMKGQRKPSLCIRNTKMWGRKSLQTAVHGKLHEKVARYYGLLEDTNGRRRLAVIPLYVAAQPVAFPAFFSTLYYGNPKCCNAKSCKPVLTWRGTKLEAGPFCPD